MATDQYDGGPSDCGPAPVEEAKRVVSQEEYEKSLAVINTPNIANTASAQAMVRHATTVSIYCEQAQEATKVSNRMLRDSQQELEVRDRLTYARVARVDSIRSDVEVLAEYEEDNGTLPKGTLDLIAECMLVAVKPNSDSNNQWPEVKKALSCKLNEMYATIDDDEQGGRDSQEEKSPGQTLVHASEELDRIISRVETALL